MATETTKEKTKKEKEDSSLKLKTSAKKTPSKEVSKEAKDSSVLAIIRTGSKQYLVEEGDTIKIEKIKNLKEGDSKIIFDEVLLLSDKNGIKIGEPLISGGKVSAELIDLSKDKKVTVIRYRAKSRYFKKNGHRQPKMTVRITSIK